jgi:23S rRNA-/tRNA-specific pseudouridylate synthase
MTDPHVLFENADFVVLDKPAGWFSIPAREPDPAHRVLTEWLAKTRGISPFVVHRLDRFTSGVILFAKNADAHRLANRWFLKREVKKIYAFLAAPEPSRPAIQIRQDIDGKPAQTLFEIVRAGSEFWLGKATPLTGRFHQVREHAQAGGFPLLGDHAYGGLRKLKAHGGEIPRVCLHAAELSLPLEVDGKKVVLRAPLPEDFLQLIKTFISPDFKE